MTDISKILDQLMGSGAAGGFAGGLAGGLASSVLTSKKGRKLGTKALKLGGIAALGAMAYGAFQKYNSNQPNRQRPAAPVEEVPLQPAPEDSPFLPAQNDSAGMQHLRLILVRAMIAAARADGTLDAQESQAIFQRIESLGLPAEERDQLVQELGRPVDIDAIVQSATSQEIAAEIYLVSLMAIDVDTVEEQSYLAMLAARMGLPRELVQELHAQVEEYTVPIND